jgi:hypothetical protein
MAINLPQSIDQARVQAYIRKFGYHEHDVLKKCRLETLKSRKDATMMTAPEKGFGGWLLYGVFEHCIGLGPSF